MVAMRRLLPALAVLAGIAGALSGSPARADDLLAKMEGSWTGSGTAREEVDAPAEPVRCRIQNSYDGGAQRLAVSGRCAASGRAVNVRGHLRAGSSAGSYFGEWTNPFGGDPLQLSGRRAGNTISFRYSTRDPKSNSLVRGTIVWRLSNDHVTLQTYRMSGGQSVLVGRVRFRR